MHEMSIVAGIINIVEDQAKAAKAEVINSIEVDVGRLAGIELDSLRFCFETARRGTLAETAELVINDLPGQGRCPDCQQDVDVDYHMAVCPLCDKALLDVFQGRELQVKSINVD